MKVEATQLGFYGQARKRPGEVFVIDSPAHFSELWMRKIEDDEEKTRRGRKPKAEEVQPEA
jgi:hypothetical protein